MTSIRTGAPGDARRLGLPRALSEQRLSKQQHQQTNNGPHARRSGRHTKADEFFRDIRVGACSDVRGRCPAVISMMYSPGGRLLNGNSI